MQQQLINLSPDLARLRDEGFDIMESDGYLYTRQVPYVTTTKTIEQGVLVCVLTYATPSRVGAPPDHTIYFIGSTPCDSNGLPLDSIINNSSKQQINNQLVIDHYFSSKPASGNYSDYYQKVATYAQILGSQAQAIDPTVTWRPLKNKQHEQTI